MRRPPLREISLPFALDDYSKAEQFTMIEGQWNLDLETAYKRGSVLIELNHSGRPVRAWCKHGPSNRPVGWPIDRMAGRLPRWLPRWFADWLAKLR
jgi:hypothetical protein